MARKLIMLREGPKLVPASPADLEDLERYAQGARLVTELSQFDRSAAQWRWWMALTSTVAEAIGQPHHTVLLYLKDRAGQVDYLRVGKHRMFVPRETGPNSDMDQSEFNEYVDFCVDVILSELMRGAKRRDLIRKVDELTGIKWSDFAEAA